MEETFANPSSDERQLTGAVKTATRFLAAIFGAEDTILLRPVETWAEGDRRKSKTDYRNTRYPRCASELTPIAVLQHLKRSAANHTNLFFGVCPRFGDQGRYDLAWQIRTVRTLWADIDHLSVDEALGRVAEAGLPPPSIVVNSGNGAHLYWLLEQPYLIDDVGDPPPVETEFVEAPNGKREPRKYLLEDGERIYLDRRRHQSRLSPKASRLQDILAGIAQACGGDKTKDVSRLMRVPGTLNRKDERNGSEPRPTSLVSCDPSLRYPLATFEPFAIASPDTERASQIAAMPLPRTRKVSASKADKLEDRIAASAIAPAGGRSEADFALVCYAIRIGMPADELWARVEQTGKFAEGGRRYFNVTWENAEFDIRAAKLDDLQGKSSRKRTPGSGQASRVEQSVGHSEDRDAYCEVASEDQERPTISVDAVMTPVGETMHQITDRLLATGECFSRADQLVVVAERTVRPILSTPELSGLLNQHVEFYFVDGEGGEYRPIPPAYGNTWLNRVDQRARLPAIKLFTHNPVYTEDWRLVEPGYDIGSGIYYAGESVEPQERTEHLDTLLRDFCFKSPADRTNYIGVLLTALLVPRFIGSKPAVLFNGNQPELGKSILAQIIAILRDGHPTETASYNPNDEEFEKRLGAVVRRGVTTIVIDNAKGRGRNPRIESACLERSITDPILSFRLLGQSASIRAENSHIFCITANTPDVSRDLVTRSVVINLYYEGDPARREFSIDDPEGFAQQHRLELLGELIGMVERWKASGMPMAKVHSRFNKRGWGNIVGGILEACGEPDFLANADEAAALLDETRREFAELIVVLAEHAQGTWTASELVELCGTHGLLSVDLGEGSPRSLATKMGTLAGRFVAERFPLSDGRVAVFHRTNDRNGNLYRVGIHE